MKQAPIAPNQTVMGTIKSTPVYNTSYAGFEPQELQPLDLDYTLERTRAQTKNSKDGVQPMSPQELEEERELDWKLVKKFTMNIFKCDFTSFSFPVGFSEPRSFLERTGDLLTFLAKPYAAKMLEAHDPYTKISHLASGIVAGFHLYLQSKKPWNPVLGETYIGQWSNGTQLFAEQISHHPAISSFQLIGPHYECHATCRFSIASGIRQVDILQNGIFHLNFDDGSKYEWEFPMISVYGIIWGDRYVGVVGTVTIRDVTNNLTCEVKIAPKGNKSKFFYTALGGGIKADPKSKNYDMQFSGDYTQHFSVNDEVYWNINEDFAERPLTRVDPSLILPSDCRFRLDRMFLIKGDLETAGDAKTVLEECQRREEKLRLFIPKQ